MYQGRDQDAELTTAAMNGDEAAFEKLIKRHQSSVRALARRLSGSASNGDDIAQSAFLIAWRRRTTWRGGSFRSWVCSIAYREFLQDRQRLNREHTGDWPETADPAIAGEGEREDILRAFAQLEANERAAVALCLGSGLSHSEASIVMHAPLGSVKSWVNRGRQKLQRLLAAYEKV